MALVLTVLVLPILEIALFILVGGWIGLWPTIALVVAMVLLGAAVVRRVGTGAIRQVQARLQAGEDPGNAMAHAALMLVAGVLLILPGFLTDGLGLLLLFPPVRSAVIGRIGGRMTGGVLWQSAGLRRHDPSGQTVDGVWHEAPPPTPRPSGWLRDPAD